MAGQRHFMLDKTELYAVLAIGCYWAWAQSSFFNVSFKPEAASATFISLINLGAHIASLILLACVIARRGSYLNKPAVYGTAAGLTAAGSLLLHAGSAIVSSGLEVAGTVLGGLASAALLPCWAELLANMPNDSRRKNVLSGAALVAVTACIVIRAMPAPLQLVFQVLFPLACGVLVYLSAQFPAEETLLVEKPTRRAVALWWIPLVLCAFLFSVPLSFFRTGEVGGVNPSISATMLPVLCVIFLLDYLLCRKFYRSMMPQTFVLLTSGGLLLLPFLTYGNLFLTGVLIMAGGYVFRAYIYTEFVRVSKKSALSPILACMMGTVLMDGGQVAGTLARAMLQDMPSGWLMTATMGIVYALFFVGFLLFTRKTEPLLPSKPSGSAIAEAPDEGYAAATFVGEVEKLCNLAGERYGLSSREREVAALVVRGRSVQSIAEQMVVSQNTVKTHMARVYRKCDVHSREELIRLLENFKDSKS